jgi:Spy/CpxP family protein refolding chaperone
MKRMVFNALLAALIGVSGFMLSDAQDRGARGPRPGGGPGFGGWGAVGLARFADLTEEQRKQVQAILEEDRASREGPPPAVTLHRQLEAEILAEVPDEQKIEALRQQLVQAQSDEVARQLALQRKIAQLLTPEQRSKARERLEQAPRGRGEGRRQKPQLV